MKTIKLDFTTHFTASQIENVSDVHFAGMYITENEDSLLTDTPSRIDLLTIKWSVMFKVAKDGIAEGIEVCFNSVKIELERDGLMEKETLDSKWCSENIVFENEAEFSNGLLLKDLAIENEGLVVTLK